MTTQQPHGYEAAKTIARDADANARRDLAAREDIRPEILYYLAEDRDADVRAAIAANQKTPGHADLLLARDPDDTVRCRLARKIGRLVPTLSEAAKDRMRDLTLEILQILVRDRLPDVRRMLAEELRATAQVPRDVICKLAWDCEIGVAAPVLEFSPLLTDTDLLALIAAGPDKERVTAIARREAVSEPVSDAIVETESVPAIATLLANPSAQIREETLDRIVTKAPATPSWHAPLARHPALSPSMIRKLTGFLAASLLNTLQRRGDLDPETAAIVATAIHDRLQTEEAKALSPGTPEKSAQQNAASEVRDLLEKGQLDEKAIAAAVGEGKHFFVTEALAALAHVPVKMAARILGAGNAAAVAALSWKASLGARLASRIQTRIAHVPPTEALNTETDAYPMDEAAMRLQLDSFQTTTETEIDAKEPSRAAGPVDPDWVTEGTDAAQQVAEPDWAQDETDAAQHVAEPDWAQDEMPADEETEKEPLKKPAPDA